jgi:hypothetical protein
MKRLKELIDALEMYGHKGAVLAAVEFLANHQEDYSGEVFWTALLNGLKGVKNRATVEDDGYRASRS